ncbi:hypothetical protein DFR50_11540 [Roseiarcus fermentans]|uniref:Uncharacterized protein n=1 Tax=Roseiarcus fermentans TaxID=1473586 RepID=A0A366FB93_9HYPH|nr:hypothetical protein DFR50_11540 [Roseiarcus fermentans]
MPVTSPSLAPASPIFTVEIIDPDGFAWLYGPLFLHEALKISRYFECEARSGKEPRVNILPAPDGAGQRPRQPFI